MKLNDTSTSDRPQHKNEPCCPTCGRSDFDSERAVKIHHKSAHGESLKPTVSCENCGDEFHVKPKRVDTAMFCSEECQEAYWDQHHRETQICNVCGQEYSVKAAESENTSFCSRNCLGKARKNSFVGEDNPRWNGGEATVVCEYCGDEYAVKPAKADNTRFCSMSCKGAAYKSERRGEGNPRYEGGNSDLAKTLRTLTGASAWEDVCENHRKNRCALCGISEENAKRALDVHHIIPVLAGGISEKWNLMTLCRECHPSVESYTADHINNRLILDLFDEI